MKNEELEQILNDILEESKKQRHEQQFLNKAFEKQAEDISQFQEVLSQKEIIIDISDLKDTLKKFHNAIEDRLQENIPKHLEIANQHINSMVQIYQKFKKRTKSLLIVFIIGILFVITAKYGFPIYKEHLKYKNAYEYLYYYSGNDTKDVLKEIMIEFENDSLRKIRKKELRRMKKNTKEKL